jgi:hypothetical protein
MKANKATQRALINMLGRVYREILAVEEEWDIRGDDGDFRARIEYFHDAVRAFSAGGGVGTEGKGRLSVEMLAYDIGMLRYIQASPIPKPKGKNRKLSPMTDVAENTLPRVAGDKAGVKPDAEVRNRLADLYKSYGVLFAALLSEAAERNYKSRIEESNAEVEDMAAFMRGVAAKAKQDLQFDLEGFATGQVTTPDLMNKLLAAFHSGKLKKRMAAAEAHRKLKDIAQGIDKEHKNIEQAHMNYALGQLAVYEGARDVLKKMAFKGFNIVGDFVENAVSEARRGGRGL